MEEKQKKNKEKSKTAFGGSGRGCAIVEEKCQIEKIKFQQHARVEAKVKKDTVKEGRKINSGYQISGYQNYLSN